MLVLLCMINAVSLWIVKPRHSHNHNHAHEYQPDVDSAASVIITHDP